MGAKCKEKERAKYNAGLTGIWQNPGSSWTGRTRILPIARYCEEIPPVSPINVTLCNNKFVMFVTKFVMIITLFVTALLQALLISTLRSIPY